MKTLLLGALLLINITAASATGIYCELPQNTYLKLIDVTVDSPGLGTYYEIRDNQTGDTYLAPVNNCLVYTKSTTNTGKAILPFITK